MVIQRHHLLAAVDARRTESDMPPRHLSLLTSLKELLDGVFTRFRACGRRDGLLALNEAYMLPDADIAEDDEGILVIKCPPTS